MNIGESALGVHLEPFEVQTPRLKLAGLKAVAEEAAVQNSGFDHRPVIALHGWLDNAASFIPLAGHLRTRRPFFAIELPGHGASEHRPTSASYHLVENVVDVVAFILTILDVDTGEQTSEESETSSKADFGSGTQQKVTLIGHSLGGVVASMVAASRPDLVDKVVLLDSLGPFADSTDQVLPQLRKAIQRATIFKSSRMTVYPSLERATRVRMSGVGQVSYETARLLVDRGVKATDDGYIWTSDPRLMAPSFVRFSEAQVAAIFKGIECPVMLICGSEGYFVHYTGLSSREAYISDLERHLVAGGHHFHMEGDVPETAKLIDGFIDG